MSPPATRSTVRAWLLIPVASIVPAVLDAGQQYLKSVLDDRPGIDWSLVLFQGMEWLFLGLLAPLTWVIARRVPFERARWHRAVLAHAAGALVLCIAWASLGIGLGRAVGTWMAEGTLSETYVSWALTSAPWSVIMYGTVLGSVFAFQYFSIARERELQASRLSAMLSDARLGALRAQLHPHFLFNSLNTITVLVREGDTRVATRMLELLGDLLHELVRSDRPQLVSLEEELRMARRYLDVEQVRFADRLRVEWRIDDGARDVLVPDLLLQPVIENAVRHGVAGRADAGRIEIAASVRGDTLEVMVADDGAGIGERTQSPGVGLSNTAERLATLYGAEGTVKLESNASGGATVRIRLPLHRSA